MSNSARGARHDLSYNMDDAPHSSSGLERGFSGSEAEFDDRDVMTPMGAIDLSENFKVAIRVRPPVPRELEGSRGFINVVRIPPDQQSITLCDVDAEDGRGNVYATQSYTFDNVYDPSARQRDVYDRSAHPAVQSVLQGYNATVMAYGQTGTGKTYTMEGFTNGEHRGIIPMATEEIFAFIENNRNSNLNFKVRASYLQIYNEVVSDLLKAPSPAKQLVIRQSKNRVYVDGLSEWVVKSSADIFGLMERGCTVRATASHRMSELSSRSHAIFQIIVEILEGDYDAPQSFKVGKLNIVDLAGSEKVRSTGVTGQRLEEAKKINWSLHQLGNVISALTDPNRRDPHIPYRNSKLTHLLTDSLGGNCKTTLIACISPAFESYNESLSTLKFANRAKNIKNDAVVNEDADQRALIAKYEKELKRLRIFISDQQEKGIFGPDPDRRLRAEADRDVALEALEARDRYLDEEKRVKQRLEGRIDELERQLLSNGVVEADNASQKEDMAQVERYKQLLLKQRDIMLNLTQRLNERDETILRLQEEIDAYDAHVQELEDQLEGKSDVRSPLLAPKTKAEAERQLAKCKVFVRGEPRYQSENGGDRLLTAEEKIVELLSLGAGTGSQGSASNGGGGQALFSSPSSLTPVHGAHTDPETKRALEVAMKKYAEDFAATLVRDRCADLLDEVSNLRARLAEAQQELRTSAVSEEVAASGRSLAQPAVTDRIREHVNHETQAIRDSLGRRIEQLESLLAAERSDSKKLASDLQRVSFQVSRMRETLEPSRVRDLDGLWETISKIEASVGRDVASAIAKLSAPSARRVDPNASSSIAQPNSTAQSQSIRVMQLESAVDTLKRQQAATRQEMQAQVDERAQRVRELESELVRREQQAASVKKSLHTHEKDRAALKKILEQRIKVKLDGIAAALRAGGDVRRVDPELSSLQNLVNASISAMNADQQPAGPTSS